ncbi:MAG: KEOPS complex subunit Pcc1 [Metallosphaera sp.]
MYVKVRLELVTPFSKEMVDSLKADNIDLPHGMKIEMRDLEGKVEVCVEVELVDPKSVLTLRNTVDEILEHIELVDNVLKRST